MKWSKVVAFTVFVVCLAASAMVAESHDPKKDERTLLQLEDEWFHSPSVATRERIYAPDFMHIIGDGEILGRQDEIDYLHKHPLPAQDESRRRFEEVKVRLYGDVGIVTGRTVITDEKGSVVRETSFTDVFCRRDGRWQAINAQETPVDKRP